MIFYLLFFINVILRKCGQSVMFEQDYVMRLIHEMVRTILKLLFKIEDETIEDLQLEDSEVEKKYKQLINLAHNGKINEAENQLYEGVDRNNKVYLKAALMFYGYLNELDIDTLEQANFSRDEIKDGITRILGEYGYEGFTDIFIN